MTAADILKKDPNYFRWLVWEVHELTERYGKYRVLCAIEQMEKKYECKTKG